MDSGSENGIYSGYEIDRQDELHPYHSVVKSKCVVGNIEFEKRFSDGEKPQTQDQACEKADSQCHKEDLFDTVRFMSTYILTYKCYRRCVHGAIYCHYETFNTRHRRVTGNCT